MLSVTPEGRVDFQGNRCCQCGICLASCPVGALTENVPDDQGMTRICWNSDACTHCGLCIQVCPAHAMPGSRMSEQQVEQAAGSYLGYAVDPAIRWMGSSGGVARALIDAVLRKKLVDAAYALAVTEAGVQASEPAIKGTWWTEPPSPGEIATSIYRPVMWGKQLLECNPGWKKVLMVGLPCQIQGAKRLLADRHPDLAVMSVVLLCRQQKTLAYTRRLHQLLGAPPDTSLSATRYRGESWPGVVRIEGASAKSVPFLETGFAFGGGVGLWTLPACDVCANPTGSQVADICLADPWGRITPGMDAEGTNFVVAWTPTGRQLLESVRDFVRLHEIPAQEAVTLLDLNRIRRKQADIPMRLGHQAESKAFQRQERIRARHEKIFSRIHPDSRLWRTYTGLVALIRRGGLLVTRFRFKRPGKRPGPGEGA